MSQNEVPYLFRMPYVLRAKLKLAAKRERHTMKDELIIALEKHLDSLERK